MTPAIAPATALDIVDRFKRLSVVNMLYSPKVKYPLSSENRTTNIADEWNDYINRQIKLIEHAYISQQKINIYNGKLRKKAIKQFRRHTNK
ncbi:hypothetical protein GCHA_0808 [Paraglaciecola chathamensis S18K6]|uniref:Uncharacterized protein n=1 Tax=Paraglaciecola chathamensis S18K6 TaxID=1127672 RepID=A0AAV3UUN0_9ALTE|nr:hypothetical protein GCHA_0808 [Paraglaciecola chathamensis S18K6]